MIPVLDKIILQDVFGFLSDPVKEKTYLPEVCFPGAVAVQGLFPFFELILKGLGFGLVPGLKGLHVPVVLSHRRPEAFQVFFQELTKLIQDGEFSFDSFGAHVLS